MGKVDLEIEAVVQNNMADGRTPSSDTKAKNGTSLSTKKKKCIPKGEYEDSNQSASPMPTQVRKIIFRLKKYKGSDASWKNSWPRPK